MRQCNYGTVEEQVTCQTTTLLATSRKTRFHQWSADTLDDHPT